MPEQTVEMIRYSNIQANKGIKIFGQRSVAEMLKEYSHIHDMKTIGSMDPNALIYI